MTTQIPANGPALPELCCLDRLAADHGPRPKFSFPGAPLPVSALTAIGARRSGPWLIGFATAIIVTVLVLVTGFSPAISDKRVAPLLSGAIAGLLVGVGAAYVTRSAVNPATTYPEQEQELLERGRQVCERLASLVGLSDPATRIRGNVDKSLCELAVDLRQPGPQWLDATGFLDSWSKLHEAEQQTLLIDLTEKVTGEAMYDLLRLDNSMIPGKDQLTVELKAALPFLSDAAADQIKTPHVAPLNEQVARDRIRNVRLAINEDREQQWAQIVRSRNSLLTAGGVAMGIAYLLVVLAVGSSAAAYPMASALVFALIGALVSATHQLLVRSNQQNDVEDFGFSAVKLLVVPLLSGLVAVLAVVLLTQIQLTLSGQTLGGSFTSWQATFDWRKNPSAVTIAIIFGFAPSLFFSIVQSRVDDAMKSIKSSQPSGKAPN